MKNKNKNKKDDIIYVVNGIEYLSPTSWAGLHGINKHLTYLAIKGNFIEHVRIGRSIFIKKDLDPPTKDVTTATADDLEIKVNNKTYVRAVPWYKKNFPDRGLSVSSIIQSLWTNYKDYIIKDGQILLIEKMDSPTIPVTIVSKRNCILCNSKAWEFSENLSSGVDLCRGCWDRLLNLVNKK